MASIVIDNARTTERLSAFLTELGDAEPVDQYFAKYPTIERLAKRKVMQDGGRQISLRISMAGDPNMDWADDYDAVNTAQSDKVRTVVYPFVNIFSSIVISRVEMREIAGSDHMIFDRVKFGRDTVLSQLSKNLNSALYAAAQLDEKIQSLAVMIDSSGSVGGIDAAVVTQWASVETSHGAAYAAGGYEQMLGMYNDLWEKKSEPTVIMTTKAIYEAYEAELNQDVRYVGDAQSSLGRGASDIMFKRIPIKFDSDCTALAMYFINEEALEYRVDSDGDSSFDPFAIPDDQHARVSKFFWRGNVILKDRRGQGKITNIS